MNDQKWKSKFNDFLNVCSGELKKTTEIGKKMLNASKANSDLHEAYEGLGRYICEQIRLEKMKIDDEEVANLVKKISTCEEALENLEKEVKIIKEKEKNLE